MGQYEKKCRQVEDKHRLEIQEYKNSMDAWKDKYANSNETRDMLDENVRVLSRRINDMELEITDKNEKLKKTERVHAETNAKLDTVWDD
jgi:chromosome segregation ATPase